MTAKGTGFTSELIRQTLSRVRSFWTGGEVKTLRSTYTPPDYRQMLDENQMLKRACECIRADGESGRPDILPTFWPDFGTVTTAAVYGGRRIPASAGGSIHIEPIVRELSDLETIQTMPFEDTDYQRAICLYREVCCRLESDEVFVRTPDFQGPMNTLALLMDQGELMCALYDAPDLIQAALEKITNRLIEDHRRFLREIGPEKVIGNIWPYVILPSDLGVCLTQDYMPLLGPDQYRIFELPRLKQINDAFGGVVIHCCGKYGHHLPALLNADLTIHGLEMHYPETKLWEVYAAFGDRIALFPYIAPTGLDEFPSVDAFLDSIRTKPCGNGRFWICA